MALLCASLCTSLALSATTSAQVEADAGVVAPPASEAVAPLSTDSPATPAADAQVVVVVETPVEATAVEAATVDVTEAPAPVDEAVPELAAADEAPVFEEPWIEVHAFVSQGFMLSTGNNYLARSKHGSFEMTEVGINFTKSVTDQLRLGVQLFTRDLGPIGNYEAKLDWFYLDYRFANWLGVRAGRTKLPFGLYNEVNDVDVARNPILLPQAVYPITNRDLLLAQTGGEIYGYVPLGDAGAFDYRLYGGTIYVAPADRPPYKLEKVSVPYVAGARALWETPLPGLRAAFSFQLLRIDADYSLAGLEGLVQFKYPFVLWLASLEYEHEDLLLSAEYGRWRADVDISIAGMKSELTVVNERYYVMAAYRLTDWFVPGAYYSVLIPNVDDRGGRDSHQHDVAITLRFDLNRYWLVKLEGHFFRGTAELDEALNNGPPSDLQANWTAFFVKTTAAF